MLIVVLAGAIGSWAYAAFAFSIHMARRTFDDSWVWWYILRLPYGAFLAFILYLVLRGGVFAGSFSSADTVLDEVNPFGFAALGALAGMYAQQASVKLKEIFESIFRSSERPGSSGARPVVEPINPIVANKAGLGIALTVKGRNFDKHAKVLVGGQPRTTTEVSATALTAQLEPGDIAAAGSFKLAISNPADKGGDSPEITVQVVEPSKLVLDAFSSPISVGQANPVLSAKGRNFAAATLVTVDGMPRTSKLVSDKELIVELTAEDVQVAGRHTLRVAHPEAKGDNFAEQDFEVGLNGGG